MDDYCQDQDHGDKDKCDADAQVHEVLVANGRRLNWNGFEFGNGFRKHDFDISAIVKTIVQATANVSENASVTIATLGTAIPIGFLDESFVCIQDQINRIAIFSLFATFKVVGWCYSWSKINMVGKYLKIDKYICY